MLYFQYNNEKPIRLKLYKFNISINCIHSLNSTFFILLAYQDILNSIILGFASLSSKRMENNYIFENLTC